MLHMRQQRARKGLLLRDHHACASYSNQRAPSAKEIELFALRYSGITHLEFNKHKSVIRRLVDGEQPILSR